MLIYANLVNFEVNRIARLIRYVKFWFKIVRKNKHPQKKSFKVKKVTFRLDFNLFISL